MLETTMIGRLGRDAQITQTTNGSYGISFTLASTKKNKEGKEFTTWVNATKWVQPNGSTAIAQYLKKGTLVYIRGEISAEIFNNSPLLRLRVDSIQLLSKSESTSSNSEPTKVEDPFESSDDQPPF